MPTYYSDPLSGSHTNDGSAESPWGSIVSVMANNKSTLVAGDIVLLRRGYHGILDVTGVNSSDIFLHAAPGHSPTVRAIRLTNATHWNIRGLTVSTSTTPSGHADAAVAISGVTIGTQAVETSHYNTIQFCNLYTVQDSSAFTAKNWASAKAGITVSGTNNVIRGNHLYNGGGIQILFHANNTYVGYNTVENVGSDCFGLRGNFCTIEFNLFRNTHKVDANHNDLFQAWGSTGNIVRNNDLRAYTDPHQPFISDGKSSPTGISITQGIGMFDGTFKNWTIENNVIRVDHTIGIWILGPEGCTIRNNTIFRCGAKVWSSKNPPGIRIAAGKTGRAAKNNIVTGNRAMAFALTPTTNGGSSIGTQSDNVKITTYNDPADGIAPTAPTNLEGSRVTGYGIDLTWTASTDAGGVAGYDIFRNGDYVGRVRTGTNFFVVRSASGYGTYTIQAFDRRGNRSVMSAGVSLSSGC